ncbi:transcriptional regulator [Burkholderia dolosa]|uniref:Transcriptional regulator n=1 Tax=Burkholderia dolosa TaxID=152500 RepID=A0A892ID82_9BURK|nr:transcriptional regulator [Burkholderia dolosa]PRE49263.1 transcriptional regulator [Burkholderia sp. AU12872]PUA76439.1 transcriptional regulator [Burkholderia sp. AU29985]MBR8419820.1 transcriptional regulator [Burkholderia dolosa]MBY4657922.1 transcriptional regulator [Burkholderia dolosa]
MCRESWRKLGLAGKAPQPIRFSPNHSVYSNAEVHRWIADPLNYQPPVAKDAA